MKILVAPNSFKECSSSVELASLISSELQKKNFTDLLNSPVSDGGDDFLEVYTHNFPCKSLIFQVKNCYNAEPTLIPAAYDNNTSTFILESAQLIGLRRIPPIYRNPVKLNSENVGILLKDILKNHKTVNVLIGLGGTGTTDLGLGLCKAFGLKLYDHSDADLEIIPQNYPRVQKITLPEKTSLKIEAVIDVLVPLYGKHGSAFVFAGQKGASEKDIRNIDDGFRNILKILMRDHNLDFTERNIGAAGGLALGLSLICDLKITSSHEFLKQTLGIINKINSSELVITAEGRFDEQSLMNKATGVIVNEALSRNKDVVIITGECLVSFDQYPHPPKVFELIKLLGSKEKALTQYRTGISLSINELMYNL